MRVKVRNVNEIFVVEPPIPAANMKKSLFPLLWLLGFGIAHPATALTGDGKDIPQRPNGRPNVLFIVCDQFRADAIAALGNSHLKTPNIDRLVKRGVTFANAYATTPECIPSRYTIITGCDAPKTGFYHNVVTPQLAAGQPAGMEERCGKYLPRVMAGLGYRTFGIGKFHTTPDMNEDIGFETYQPTVLGLNVNHDNVFTRNLPQKPRDAYAEFIVESHPEFNWLDSWVGESELYYIPQTRPMPAEICVESWATDQAVAEIRRSDPRPFFGMVSYFGPHAPMAPPAPYNHLYDPDAMPAPVCGDVAVDFMDDRIPSEAFATGSEEVTGRIARQLKARYYGEITFIDEGIGRILDAVEARPDADNTVICFFADHGEMLGDHGGWQKENFFEPSTHIPFLVSWPARLPANVKSPELVGLSDLFGIATSAAGTMELRDGADALGIVNGQVEPRGQIVGRFGLPGTPAFKVMVREKDWKYIFLANGGREQLFHVTSDPNELKQMLDSEPEVAKRLRAAAIEALAVPGGQAALQDGDLRRFSFQKFPRVRYPWK